MNYRYCLGQDGLALQRNVYTLLLAVKQADGCEPRHVRCDRKRKRSFSGLRWMAHHGGEDLSSREEKSLSPSATADTDNHGLCCLRRSACSDAVLAPARVQPRGVEPLCEALDLPDGYGFCDVFGLDDEPQQNSRRQRPRRFRTGTSPYSVWEFRK